MSTQGRRTILLLLTGFLLVVVIIIGKKYGPGGVLPSCSEVADKASLYQQTLDARYIHEPRDNCEDRCHVKGRDIVLAGDVGLSKPVPQLCSQCHDDPMGPDADAYVHGPVAVGECLFCHDAHASNHRALLKQTVPDLCYMCHDMQDVAAVADHGQPSYENCIRCHDSHGGSSRSLLKADWKQAPH